MLSSPINITHNATSVGDINPTSTTARTLHQCRVSPLHWGPKAPKKKRRRGKRLEPNNGDERCGSNEPLIFSELHPHRIKGPSMSQSWVISSPSCFLGDRALGHNFFGVHWLNPRVLEKSRWCVASYHGGKPWLWTNNAPLWWKRAAQLAMRSHFFLRPTTTHGPSWYPGMLLEHIQVGLLTSRMSESAREDLLAQHPACVQVHEKICQRNIPRVCKCKRRSKRRYPSVTSRMCVRTQTHPYKTLRAVVKKTPEHLLTWGSAMAKTRVFTRSEPPTKWVLNMIKHD